MCVRLGSLHGLEIDSSHSQEFKKGFRLSLSSDIQDISMNSEEKNQR
jgi:hypothetical protein